MTESTQRERGTSGGESSSLPGRSPTALSKEASATVYLMEELGDARMRCDQLLRYIEKASKLIEKSSHRDHFFEVAGDIIRGIPESAFKLHKALEAVALAANRIDYEEIKQDLLPQKVEELERVLKDVRVRHVQRRSLPMVNPANVAQQLKTLAKRAKDEGKLDTTELSTLIASLEDGVTKSASANGVAAQLDAMVHALENPPKGEKPSRQRLAQALRTMLAQHVELPGGKAAAEDEKRSRFEEGKPADPTENMDKEDAKAWKDNTDKYEDKFKKEAGKPSSGAVLELKTAILALNKILRGENPKRMLHVVVMSLGRAAEHLGQENQIPEILYRASDVINRAFSVADMREYSDEKEGIVTAAEDEAKRSRFEEGKPADPTKNMDKDDAKAWKDNTEEYGDKFKKEAAGESAPAVAANLPVLHRLIDSCEEAAKQIKHSVGLIKQDAGRYAPQADNIEQQVNALATVVRVVQRRVFDVKTASDKTGAGNIPPPDQNVIDEIMSWHGGQGSKLYSVGSRWNAGHPVSADDAEEVFDELESHHADHNALADFEQHLMSHGVTPTSVQQRIDKMKKRELKEMQDLLKGAGFNTKDAKKLQDEGMGPEELRVVLRRPAGAVGSLEYTHNLQRKTKKASESADFWKAE